MTRFWWVRHGPTHAKTMVGWSDLPADLSDTVRLARLSSHLPHAPVISSDLTRTRATADAIQGARPRLPDDPDLREMHFGDWELMSFPEIEARDPELSRAYWENPGDVRPPNGESWHETQTRVSRAVARLSRYDEVIIVAHFGVILTQLALALRRTPADILAQRIDNLSVTRIELGPTDTHVPEINHIP
ncbi:histidine phosphatase family protein [Aliiroseovarius subalbicans]|uniref:histidine phosphatase family protein n=1 Tax=Aliiroseovarius subalbicans TaxID=2925840 RepID=UPI001F59BBF1|nr:histidine phosphatase family protein [Aliiroseovarius subalbicans]MCI2399389.1 histidine phosphatase family protein [Aliiroseovarius subalbicans]